MLAKREMLRLLTTRKNAIPDHSFPSDDDYLNSIPAIGNFSADTDIQEPEIYAIFENLMSDWCVGIEAVPAIEAFYWGLPGINATSRGGD